MSTHTLYFIQSDFAQMDSALEQLQQIATQQDSIVLFADAVLFTQDERLSVYPHLYVLQQDATLNPNLNDQPVQQLDYDALAKLVLNFTRCITLK